jgi:hypothetical protein
LILANGFCRFFDWRKSMNNHFGIFAAFCIVLVTGIIATAIVEDNNPRERRMVEMMNTCTEICNNQVESFEMDLRNNPVCVCK